MWVAGVGFKVVEEKTTRVEKKGEKSERKREQVGSTPESKFSSAF